MISDHIDASRLSTLIEINELINSQYTDAKSLLTRILESAMKLTAGEASSLIMLNPENNKLYFEIALGSKGPDVQKFSLNMGEGIAGWVAQNNTPLIVNDVDSDERYFSDISKSVGFSTHSILAVPMRLKDSCIGVIEILNKKDNGVFSQGDLEWLQIFSNQAALAIQNARSYENIKNQVERLEARIENSNDYHTMVYASKEIEQLMTVVHKAAKTNASVLIQGESGVGKELIAEQLHMHSERNNEPFIRLNCAALPERLLESELFGHVKGAFTDAIANRRGRFELADGGTLFLDEIGEIPLSLQPKLLRVLESQVFEPVGSSEPIQVNVRIIAATNRNLVEEVQNGNFRKDLYYRLNVLPLKIPALRERKADIPELAEFFLTKLAKQIKKEVKGFAPEAMDALITYQWPGNIRELENVIERSLVISQDEYIGINDLMLGSNWEQEAISYEDLPLKDAVNLFKKHYLAQVLDRNEKNQTRAAEVLGVQRTYLSRLMKELNIKSK
jgi:Nif-specific regulatory protein